MKNASGVAAVSGLCERKRSVYVSRLSARRDNSIVYTYVVGATSVAPSGGVIEVNGYRLAPRPSPLACRCGTVYCGGDAIFIRKHERVFMPHCTYGYAPP